MVHVIIMNINNILSVFIFMVIIMLIKTMMVIIIIVAIIITIMSDWLSGKEKINLV